MKALAYLNKYLWKYKWRLLLGIVFITISNLFDVQKPLLVKEAVNEFERLLTDVKSRGVTDDLSSQIIMGGIYLALIYIAISLARGFFVFLNRQTIIVMSRLIEYDLKNEIYYHYQKLSPSFYRRNSTGDLMNRISEDVGKSRMYLGPAIMYTTDLVVKSILIISFMLSTNVELTLYVLIPLPVMAVLIYYISKIMNKKSEMVQRSQSAISSFAQEIFSGIREVKAYNIQDSMKKLFGGEVNNYKEKSLDLARVNALFFPVMILLIGVSTIITIYVGGLKAQQGIISTGDIAAFVVYVNMLTWPFASVGWVTSMVQRAAASQERINEFLKQVTDIEESHTPKSFNNGSIVMDQVSFVYPDSGIRALNNLSFEIKKGQTLGVIGETGSGKSSLVNLISRLYDPTEGDITIDGVSLKELKLEELRNSIGYVPQDAFLFSDTIANNIRFGLKNEEVSKDRIVQAAKDAHIHHNIIDFNEGYQTIIGERGVTLSGGQKQRISIARAIIKEPEILIFDDCLSAVDTETEDVILTNLHRIMKGKTSIVISHRISSVQKADQIIVLKDGEIIESGNHQTLLAANGYYTSLYEKQNEMAI